MAVRADLVAEVPRKYRRVRLELLERLVHARQTFALQRLRLLEPVARRVPRTDLLPHEDAGGVEPLEQRRVERVLGARRVRADRTQPADDAIHVRRRQAVTVPASVLVDRRAV